MSESELKDQLADALKGWSDTKIRAKAAERERDEAVANAAAMREDYAEWVFLHTDPKSELSLDQCRSIVDVRCPSAAGRDLQAKHAAELAERDAEIANLTTRLECEIRIKRVLERP